MGRYYTGVLTTRECIRLELKFLKDNYLIQKGKTIQTALEWTDGTSISFRSVYNDEESYIELSYVINSNTSERKVMQYKIHLNELPSNLGKGVLLYMVCPLSGYKSRILYMAYGSAYFKNIKAYRNRIYYSSQVASKYSKSNTKYWQIKEMLVQMKKKRNQKSYNGKMTKKYLYKINKERELEYLDQMRWMELPVKQRIEAMSLGLI